MSREKDIELIKKIPEDKLTDFIFMHLRDMWAIDGFYYMFIEEKYGTEVATEIDKKVWEVMGKIEARKIKKLFNINGTSVKDCMKALSFSGWSMDLEDKEIEIISKDHAILKNINCRVQNTRIIKELGEFACKPVRFSFLKSFAKEFNPQIKVICKVCPPDNHPENLWCEWEFILKKG